MGRRGFRAFWNPCANERGSERYVDERAQSTEAAQRPLTTVEDLAQRVLERKRTVRLTGLRGAARAVVAAQLVRAHGDRPVLILVPTSKDGDGFINDLRASLGEEEEGSSGRVRPFPRHDPQPYERFSPQPVIVAQRMAVLNRWLARPPPESSGPVPPGPRPGVH